MATNTDRNYIGSYLGMDLYGYTGSAKVDVATGPDMADVVFHAVNSVEAFDVIAEVYADDLTA